MVVSEMFSSVLCEYSRQGTFRPGGNTGPFYFVHAIAAVDARVGTAWQDLASSGVTWLEHPPSIQLKARLCGNQRLELRQLAQRSIAARLD